MKKTFRLPLAMLVVALSTTGCLSMKSYVDPALHNLDWSAVRAPAQVHPVVLETEFYANGKRKPMVDKHLRGAIERALQKGSVLLVQPQAPGTLSVKVDNIANIGEAMRKGFGTGLTFGAKGSAITDGYAITIRYEHGGVVTERQYKHALHTTVGNADPVTPAAPLKPMQAFDQIIEDAVLHFLRDAQASGVLVRADRRIVPVG